MKVCANCGGKIKSRQNFCPTCGQVAHLVVVDRGAARWAVLGFVCPVLGAILYLIWHKRRPNTAKSAGLGALISVGWVVSIMLMVVVGITIGLEVVE